MFELLALELNLILCSTVQTHNEQPTNGKRQTTQGVPWYRLFGSEQNPAGSSKTGIARGGVVRCTVCTVRYRTELSGHGVERDSVDGIDISQVCTGRELRGRKKHEIRPDGVS